MLQVSTADITVIWKFEKTRDKFPLFAWEREVSFVFFSYRGIREFEGLINHDMLQTLVSKSMVSFCFQNFKSAVKKIAIIQGRVISNVNEHQTLYSITPLLNDSQVVFSLTFRGREATTGNTSAVRRLVFLQGK